MSKKELTRSEKVDEVAYRIAEGGWSSIHRYVNDHFEEDDYQSYNDEEEEGEDE